MIVYKENPFDLAISRILADPAIFPGSCSEAVCRFLYEMVTELKPEWVVEVGCYIGLSTLHIAKALRDNRKGKLIAFDLNVRTAKRNVIDAGLEDYVIFIEGDSAKNAEKYLPRYFQGPNLDLAFIDGDHTCKGCSSDFNILVPYLKRNGYVLFHDIYPLESAWYGPRYVVNNIKSGISGASFSQFQVIERYDLDPFGVAVCRKTDSGKNPLLGGPPILKLKNKIIASRSIQLLEELCFKADFHQFEPQTNNPILSIFFKMIGSTRRKFHVRVLDGNSRKTIESIDINMSSSPPKLIDGWHELEVTGNGLNYRWSEQVFKIQAPGETQAVEFFAYVPDHGLNSHLNMALFADEKKHSTIELTHRGWGKFTVPLNFPAKDGEIYEFRLNRKFQPSKGERSSDDRELGIAVNKITFLKGRERK